MTDDLPAHVAANRAAWDAYAPGFVEAGERAWRQGPGQETWGLFSIPESELRMLPDDLAGRGVIELGCGTGRVLIPTARAGFEITGLDLSPFMLNECRKKLEKQPENVKARVKLVQGNMTAFGSP